MSHVLHHAVIVTSWEAAAVAYAHQTARGLFTDGEFCLVSPITKARHNGYQSFAVLPCGSNAGWPDAEEHVRKLKEFTDWLAKQSHLQWVAIQFGDDQMGVGFPFAEIMDTSGKEKEDDDG